MMTKTILLAAALALSATATAAGADQLPAAYLGKWCLLSDDNPHYGRMSGSCDAMSLTITAKLMQWRKDGGGSGEEGGCDLRSIKRTNDLRPTGADRTPVIEVVARCVGEGTEVIWWRLIYEKGTLSFEPGRKP
jgi:hypothetical protein